MDKKIAVGVGTHTIELSDDIMKQLRLLKDCSYMQEQLDEMVAKIVEVYQEGISDREYISSDECMKMISLIYDVKRDYKFLCSLNIKSVTE